jgi:hypothetical protein
MLVCSVSQSRRRASIAVGVAEAAAAADAPGTGNVVFATLVDDPASVGDRVDAYLGQIMLEAASASSTVTAGMVYAVAVLEEAAAADLTRLPGVIAAAVVETASASATQSTSSAVMRSAVIAGLQPIVVSSARMGAYRLRSGTTLGSATVSTTYQETRWLLGFSR